MQKKEGSRAAAALRFARGKTRSKAAQVLVYLRNRKVGRKQIKAWCSIAGKATWANLTPEQRVLEMRRRRKVGMERKVQEALRAEEERLRKKALELYKDEPE